ncbi:hypothetical protein NB689_003040 [Xanthomonas sacchari]|nr:hypothetical protein [Xanthomonas sacchari]
MLRPGLRASPARFTGLWKPLKLNTMPAVATAVSTAAKSMVWLPPCRPTLKFSLWKPLAINATPVSAGTTSLNTVIRLLERANSLTLQKFSRKYTSTSTAAMHRPGTDSSPAPPGCCTYRSCAHCQGQEAMYCTEASASTGITDTIAIQLAQPAMKPTSEPCE